MHLGILASFFLLSSHENFASAVIMDRMPVVLGAAGHHMYREVNSNLTSV